MKLVVVSFALAMVLAVGVLLIAGNSIDPAVRVFGELVLGAIAITLIVTAYHMRSES